MEHIDLQGRFPSNNDKTLKQTVNTWALQKPQASDSKGFGTLF